MIKKPTIDEVCMIFHEFDRKGKIAISGNKTFSVEQISAFEVVRKDFRKKLDDCGIAQFIDWDIQV